MKTIKQLDSFPIDEAFQQPQGKRAVKTAYRFEISSQLKKVAKIQKTLIDMGQMLTEMSDEIVALKLNFPNLDPESMTVLNNMKYNLDNMVLALKAESKAGKKTGLIDNSNRLKRNLERLKKDFLSKQGIS